MPIILLPNYHHQLSPMTLFFWEQCNLHCSLYLQEPHLTTTLTPLFSSSYLMQIRDASVSWESNAEIFLILYLACEFLECQFLDIYSFIVISVILWQLSQNLAATGNSNCPFCFTPLLCLLCASHFSVHYCNSDFSINCLFWHLFIVLAVVSCSLPLSLISLHP